MEQAIKDNNSLGQDTRFKYVLTKGEKLISATYVVSSFLPDSEPIKWELRKIGLSVVSELNRFRFKGQKNVSPIVSLIISRLDHLLSLINIVLSENGAVSQMNFTVLKQELENYQKNLSELAVSALPEIEEIASLPEPKIPQATETKTESHERAISKFQVPVHQKAHQDVERPVLDLQKRKEGRRSAVLEFLRGRGWVSIGDIAKAFSDCSSKTIQRELSSLVVQKAILKKGDRRWSRYLLAT